MILVAIPRRRVRGKGSPTTTQRRGVCCPPAMRSSASTLAFASPRGVRPCIPRSGLSPLLLAEAEADGNRTHQAFVSNASPILKTGAVTRPANASEPGDADWLSAESRTCTSVSKTSTAALQANFLGNKLQAVRFLRSSQFDRRTERVIVVDRFCDRLLPCTDSSHFSQNQRLSCVPSQSRYTSKFIGEQKRKVG